MTPSPKVMVFFLFFILLISCAAEHADSLEGRVTAFVNTARPPWRHRGVDPLCCPECGGQMQVVSFIEPPQADVIEEILQHCGMWQSRSARPPPEVHDLVLQLDAAYSGSSIDPPDPADQSQELTYVDIDTFLESF